MAVSISIEIKQNSQSVANNTSNVTVSVTAKWTYGSYNQLQKSGYLTIDGTKYTFTSSFNYNATTSGSQVIFTKTVNVKHNSDGKKNLTCSASYTTGVSSGTVTASATKTLTTIARKSTLSISGDTILGRLNALEITEQDASFRHDLYYSCGSITGYLIGGSSPSTALEKNWTPSVSLASQSPTVQQVTIKFTLVTYTSSGTSIGQNTYERTYTIPASVAPSCSLSVTDATDCLSKYGKYVKGKSKLSVTITATKAYGSDITAYTATANGASYATATFTTDLLKYNGSHTVKATVKDKRSRTGTDEKTISAFDYSPPEITSIRAYRCASANNTAAVSNGAYMAVPITAVITALDNKNSATYTLAYKKSTESTFTTVQVTDLTGVYNASKTITFPADVSSSYEITFTATDDFSSAKKSVAGPSVSKVWSIFAKGLGFAFGKVAEEAGVLDVDWQIRARKGIVDDTSVWANLTVDDAFTVHNNAEKWQPRYKVTGNVVTIMGCVSPKEAFTSSANQTVICTGLPAKYCPTMELDFMCQGSSINRWALRVGPKGNISMARYGTHEYKEVPTGAWLNFCVTYQV